MALGVIFLCIEYSKINPSLPNSAGALSGKMTADWLQFPGAMSHPDFIMDIHGADRKHLLQLNNSLIISKLSYGSKIYSSATKPKPNALNVVHHAGIRIATEAFRSSPIQSLLVEAGFLPLESNRRSQIIRYWVRAQRLPSPLSFLVIFNENNPQFFFKQTIVS